uniref:autotransporter outer membrane beta-barrel domain-containing protein n=1 Tax=Campylobacter hyointestinalis TaxID=198 RepID=UPI003AF7E228
MRSVIGGEVAFSTTQKQGATNNNKVTMFGGTVNGNVVGGFANSNEVIIFGGTVNDFVYGGRSNASKTTHNVVNISGGTINGNVYGGYSSKGSATNNTVNILGNPTFRTSTIFYGGNKELFDGDIFTGNTLNIATKGLSAKNIANFEFINFYLPNNIAAGNTILNLSDTYKTDLSKSKIGVAMQSGANESLKVGDKVILIKNNNGGIISPNDPKNHIGNPNNIHRLTTLTLSNIYDFDISSDPKSLYASLRSKKTNPSQKNILETGAGMLGIIGTNTDTIDKVMLNKSYDDKPSVFARTNGYDTRLKSGSHIDIKGANAIAGVSKKINDNYTHGLFMEFGKGKYDSYNDFNGKSIHGKGDSKYYGIGYLGKLDELDNDIYLEGSLRLGKIKSDYKGYGFGIEENPTFNTRRTYYATHLGAGKIFNLTKRSNIDTYLKAYYTRIEGDKIETLKTKFKFNTSDSFKTKLGARYNYNFTNGFGLYAGAAYEREFRGDIKGKNLTFDYNLDAPSLKGNSGIAEIGIRYTKFDNKKERFVIDLGTQESIGKKKGASGTLSLKYEF